MILIYLFGLAVLSFGIYNSIKTLIDLKDYYKRNPNQKLITVFLFFVQTAFWFGMLNLVIKHW